MIGLSRFSHIFRTDRTGFGVRRTNPMNHLAAAVVKDDVPVQHLSGEMFTMVIIRRAIRTAMAIRFLVVSAAIPII